MIPRYFPFIANEKQRGVVQNCTPGKENPMSIKGAAIVGLFLLAIGFLLYFGTKARLPISMSTLSLVSFRTRSRGDRQLYLE
jgi:drug/metabolite transporter (DMT)-like permease